MRTQVDIPDDLGTGGANLAPTGAAGSPDLKEILDDHKAAIDASAGEAATLTDAAATVDLGDGRFFRLPAGTLTANRALTLDDEGANLGDQIEVLRLDVENFTYAVVNGGPGAGTIYTFAAQAIGYARFYFNGTNWELRAKG